MLHKLGGTTRPYVLEYILGGGTIVCPFYVRLSLRQPLHKMNGTFLAHTKYIYNCSIGVSQPIRLYVSVCMYLYVQQIYN